MYVLVSVHRPHADKEKLLIDSMHRYGEACKKQKGLILVQTLKDEKSGELIGLAIWDSEDSYRTAKPALMRAIDGDNLASWEAEPVKSHRMKPV